MGSRGDRAPARPARHRRLSRSADFERVYRRGRSCSNRYLVAYAFPRSGAEPPSGSPRLGVSVGRKVGGAVERNRVKRLLREAFQALADDLPGDHDFVVVARPEAATLARERGGKGMEAALCELLAEAALVEGPGALA